MALISRTCLMSRANRTSLSSSQTTANSNRASLSSSQTIGNHTRDSHSISYETRPRTTFYSKEKIILVETAEPKDGPLSRAKRQFARRHGTTSKLVSESERNSDYCFKKLRQYDFENFLCTLLLPERARRGAIAIRAFNIEIAQVRDSIKDRMIGDMRMQFWRDSVDAMYESKTTVPQGNPIIGELHSAIETHGLTKSWLMRIIESRQEHLAEKPHPTLDDLETYAETTVSSVNYLLLETLGIRDVRVDHAASHLGKAQGLVTAIRAVPFHAKKRQVLLPIDVLIKHGASAEDFIQERRTEAVREVIFDLASQAHAHLDAGRSMADHVPKPARPALLTSVATHDFLMRLRKLHFDPYHPKVAERNQLLPMRLWWKNARSSY